MEPPLLEVRNLRKYFHRRKGIAGGRELVKAVDDVSFSLRKGETLGLVGESGCGKSTTGRCIVRATEPNAGELLLSDGEKITDLASLPASALRKVRRRLQMIFQDPFASLNPRMTVYEIVVEPLVCLGIGSRKERRERVGELLQTVGLNPSHMERYPHSFSGGQRQRIGIARALAPRPDLIVADEAVSALDVSIQAQVLNLLQDLQDTFGMAYLFIAHDLSVVEHLCDRVAVMYVGKIVELAPVDDLFSAPAHPYVEALLSAVPRPDPHHRLERMVLAGEVADPADRPSGCAFHPRCPYARDICRVEEPELRQLGGDSERLVACHFAEELTLAGVEP